MGLILASEASRVKPEGWQYFALVVVSKREWGVLLAMRLHETETNCENVPGGRGAIGPAGDKRRRHGGDAACCRFAWVLQFRILPPAPNAKGQKSLRYSR